MSHEILFYTSLMSCFGYGVAFAVNLFTCYVWHDRKMAFTGNLLMSLGFFILFVMHIDYTTRSLYLNFEHHKIALYWNIGHLISVIGSIIFTVKMVVKGLTSK
jgi:hypothetical protein